MKTSPAGIDAIATLEGFSANPCRDAKGWSKGYGHFIRQGESSAPITRRQARALLEMDIRWAEHCVDTLVRVPLLQCQYDAVVSLVFNIGASRFGRSVTLTRINSHSNDAIRKEWSEFRLSSFLVSPSGVLPEVFETRVNPVLVARRKKELAMYFGEVA